MRSEGNGQGLVDLGINMNTQEVYDKISNKEIRGMIIMGGEDHVTLPRKIEFLVVQGEYSKELEDQADVLLPSPTHVESEGTVTSQDRWIQHARSAVKPHCEMTNVEQIRHMMMVFSNKDQKIDVSNLLESIGKSIPEYLHAHETENENRYWPIGKSRILYVDKYATDNGKAKLQPVEENVMYL